ncbi:MAG TPA: exo-alpha-sialidase [bacterium]|nr:exo-alpha-sialidase [bacterium]
MKTSIKLGAILVVLSIFQLWGNIIENPSFENVAPQNWNKATWGGEDIKFYHTAQGRNNSNCISISSSKSVNSAWYTTASVRPNTEYRLTGWIKTNKVKPQNGKGALIVLNFAQEKAPVLTGTNDWKEIIYEFNSSNRDRITIYCLLGGWGTASGQAWFDDISITPKNPIDSKGKMEIEQIKAEAQVVPLLINKPNSQLLEVVIKASGSDEPLSLQNLDFELTGYENIQNIYLYGTKNSSKFSPKFQFGYTQNAKEQVSFSGEFRLQPGKNHFWMTCQLKNDANQLDKISAKAISATINNKQYTIQQNKVVNQRIGFALRKHNDDGVDTYRIPGIVKSKDGTLLAIYDIRRDHSGDLQADIDVGLSRSTDGGKTWGPMKVIMDRDEWGGLSQSENGVGDPSILVDRQTGTIWVAAAWAHGMKGQRSWTASKSGMKPEETIQLLLTKSEDDGKTWSPLINITEQVKQPEWELTMVGPGSGITTSNGTLVFPAQFQNADQMPHSTILYSKDHGKTWHFGKGAKPNTTESQVVELSDSRLMLNMRDNRGGARSVYTTDDLGKSWNKHPTSRKALPEPVCNAGLIKTTTKINGSEQNVLLFVNPNSTEGRKMMTLKASLDQGQTWPKKYQILLDEDYGFGYPNLTMVNDSTIGVLYEGSQAHMVFQKILLKELISGKDK